MDKSNYSQLDWPRFDKVRYQPWGLEDNQPSDFTAEKPYFKHEESLGIEVAGSSTPFIKVPKDLQEAGLVVENLVEAKQKHPDLVASVLGKVVAPDADRLSAQNYWENQTGILLYVPAGLTIEPVIELSLDHLSDKDQIARILVLAGQDSEFKIMQHLRSVGEEKSKLSLVVEVLTQRGAKVTYANLDSLNQGTQSFINRQAQVGNDSRVDWVNAAFNNGNTISRLSTNLIGNGSASQSDVAAFTNRKQVAGFVTEIENLGRHTVGHIFQRGIILNSSALVFNGIGRIIKGAKGSDAQQESRVLMLSKRGRGEANPLLLIDENDVTAGHAASVGRVDADQLYYLMSRGLPERVARKLVIRGFVGEILTKLPTASAQEALIELIEEKLSYEK
ncbi:Fe-S cluster assembly protein SufD [Eupransor demetentiae]|uniref:Fe-S cluster assembly scaffold protein SufB (SufB) n=1 Tax=Eupransor demetentiae TaxID=3109584 RepID=A0ABM9N313_9LACO|nr:Fe-S cluster assembly scaffold protein SufB (SufB) [Lactobacillaceae bacterium LMG 33000]